MGATGVGTVSRTWARDERARRARRTSAVDADVNFGSSRSGVTPLAQVVLSAYTGTAAAVTTESDVAAAVWQAANDSSGRMHAVLLIEALRAYAGEWAAAASSKDLSSALRYGVWRQPTTAECSLGSSCLAWAEAMTTGMAARRR